MRARADGVSLLEMLLVIALIAVTGVLAVSVLGGGIEGMRLRSAGKQVADELRQVRLQAIARGTAQRFEIDPVSHRWTTSAGHAGRVPASLRLQFTGAREVQAASGRGVIQFFPDGASSGGRIELFARQARWRVDVAWITGEVRSGPVGEAR